MSRIPLRARDGSVRAWALVDDDDLERIGHLRWHLTSHGYVARTAGGHNKPKRHWYLHREILGLIHGELADHINGDKLDNRRENLRRVTPRENGQNVASQPDSTSVHRGVSWSAHACMWRATAFVDGKQRNVGYFKREQDAAIAVSLFRRAHMPYAVENRRPACGRPAPTAQPSEGG